MVNSPSGRDCEKTSQLRNVLERGESVLEWGGHGENLWSPISRINRKLAALSKS
jgi:hypothetical protein